MQQLITIRTPEQLHSLLEYLQDKEFIAFDTETTGTYKDSIIIGISVCAEEDKSFYLVLYSYNPEYEQLQETIHHSHAKKLVETLIGKKLIAHNAIFDCSMVQSNFKIDLMPYIHTDTMVLAQLLDENRRIGLKELGADLFGQSAKKEAEEMKASVKANGGLLTKDKYEMYKADSELLAKYGAKDALLTFNLFYTLVEDLYVQGLEDFFYKDESMPLLRGPTYDLNTTGLKVDTDKLSKLKGELEAECLELKAFIYAEITPHVKDKYPGTKATNTFNINAPQQLSWLLFERLKNQIGSVTDAGRDLCKALKLRPPYALADKRAFIRACTDNLGMEYTEAYLNDTDKLVKPKKVGEFWKYTSVDVDTLEELSTKYKWVDSLLKYKKNTKLLNTYVEGIQERLRHGVINPSFLQTGTTSGRYSSRNPNFQNLPRDDKRIKSCIISRPGKVFVGADYSQLEPRVFASVSQDPTLMECFAKGEDFYSIVGMPIFGTTDCTATKKGDDSFANKYPKFRNMAKAFALATPYGTSAFQQSQVLGLPKAECQNIIDKYFESYPRVELMMLERHEAAKANGEVKSLYGRPRRMPEAKNITRIYGDTPHSELPYEARNLLNLAMNHTVQSSAATIVNRAAIELHSVLKTAGIDAKIVLQVHDEIIVECLEEDANLVQDIMKFSMEKTTILPGVDLHAQPMISSNLGDLK